MVNIHHNPLCLRRIIVLVKCTSFIKCTSFMNTIYFREFLSKGKRSFVILKWKTFIKLFAAGLLP